MPSERIKGAALTGAIVGLLASKGIFVSSAAGLSAAYLAISKGVAGDVLRTVGGIAWDVTDTAARLLSIVANNDKLSMLPKGLAQKTVEALQKSQQVSARYVELADWTEAETAEKAYKETQEDLARVLEEAEAVIEEADQAIAKAQSMEDKYEEEDETHPADVSVPYDAAARLAYEQSDKSMPYVAFQSKYVADAVDMVKSKQAARVREKEEAEAQQQRAKEEEAARIKAEEEAAMLSEEDDDFMEDDDFLAAVELAQEGLEGKIVGIEDAIADTTAKAEWDAAGSLARELRQDGEDFDDDDDDDILLGSDAFEGLDMEALGRAAREAVEMFDDTDEPEEEDELWDDIEGGQDWSLKSMNDLREELRNRGLRTNGKKTELVERLEEFDSAMSNDEFDEEDEEEDDDDFDIEEDDEVEEIDLAKFDMEELGRQAREAVQMFQSKDFDDEEPTAEMLAELESEMTINGDYTGGSSGDFNDMTVAQLKDECRSRGLKVGGRKAELIERLQATTE